ncbi:MULTISPECIES: type III secretion system protein PrgE [unclassified Enterococcus]|uniref:type III secretion system protein PrgE n=1 Tax=unclassified Enterococcus TaxID=2608891 RepID=UPI001CE17E1C|nr:MULTISPECIES: type III secretion system protein PrgE [unclassified Enterococcus]MCA5014555.1 type III secretion system protein PrgE [Enterococcus sp. S23]MCA5017808.1 type III secretion system protein PrgE [Enterococcus sp. S22(2020)]
MKYQRPMERTTGPKEFVAGTYAATIRKIINKPSGSGNKMFTLFLEGKNKEQGRSFLVFGNDFTQQTLSFILASIEDNGVEIPDIEFGWNKDTYNFLLNKDVYIRVEDGFYKGQPQTQITEYLTLEEFEGSEEDSGFDEFGQSDHTQDPGWE